MVASLGLIGLATLSPQPPLTSPLPAFCIFCGDYGAVDFLLNVALFLPLGLSLGAAGHSLARAVAVAGVTTVVVELLQVRIIPGRDASAGDLLANSLGGLLGFLLWRFHAPLLRPDPALARRLSLGAAVLAAGLLTTSALALRPHIADPPYWVQFYPERPNYDVFDGRVLSLTVDGRQLEPPERAASLVLPGERLGRALTVHGRVTAGAHPDRIAPMIRVVDRTGEQVMLGRWRDALVFRRRVQGTAWRLRTPVIAASDAFPSCTALPCPPTVSSDTLRVAAVTKGPSIELSTEGAAGRSERHFSPSVGLGWVLLLPFDLPIDSRTRLLSLVWLAALAAPTGYWSAWGVLSQRSGPSWVRQVLPGVALLALFMGLLIAPLMAGLAITPTSEIAGALAGLAGGAWVARLIAAGP